LAIELLEAAKIVLDIHHDVKNFRSQ
jgi:hypothetical protein